VYDNSNLFTDKAGYTPQPAGVLVGKDQQEIAVQAGDYVTVTYDGGRTKRVYFPAIRGDSVELYIGNDGSTYRDRGLCDLAQAALPAPPTATPTPEAQVTLNDTSFTAGSQFTATFRLNKAVTRTFNAYAVVNLPDRSMLDAITLSPQIRPLATNVNGLPAGFTYSLMSLRIPPGAPKGDCSVMVGFFAPGQPITGPADAFLLATAPFRLH